MLAYFQPDPLNPSHHLPGLPHTGLSGSPTASRLDAAAVRAIDSTCLGNGTSQLREYHGIAVWDTACETLAYTGRRASSRFALANTQKLAAALLTYQDRFAPDQHWRLFDAQPEHGTLTWQCTTLDLPLVIDVITRTRHLALVDDLGEHARETHLRRHAWRHPHSPAGVIRWLDMSEPANSRLTFPEGTFTWAVVDDPIRMRELSFATATSLAHDNTRHDTGHDTGHEVTR